MVQIDKFAGELGLKQLTTIEKLDTDVKDGCVCDLLSWVMARGEEGMAWITVQTHLNVIAVACLHDFACVIIPESIEVPQATLDKANEEGMMVFSSDKTAYRLCCEMCKLGIGVG
ncbi:AraC family transcriptional regulator [Christensenellaceae bacterium OttesenSCG-928-K19]|nr:AraC family transcriptional regulator [Christensenellaceae bacterium OttesenSCG-928-K19]